MRSIITIIIIIVRIIIIMIIIIMIIIILIFIVVIKTTIKLVNHIIRITDLFNIDSFIVIHFQIQEVDKKQFLKVL